ncbi:MAG TPA: MarR family transcriptional regulator [Anaerolineales bacterium]
MSRADPLVPLLQEWIGAFMRRSMRSMILFMKENELSMTQVGALFQVQRGRTNVSDLGEGMGVTIAAASQMLERLVQQGLVRRSEDPHDRRAKNLVLTDKGCKIVQESVRARQSWVDELVASLSPGEREQVAAAVRIMIEKTEQLDHDGGREPRRHGCPEKES